MFASFALTPYKSESDLRSQVFFQKLWEQSNSNIQIVCAHNGLGISLSPHTYRYGFWGRYLSNQKIAEHKYNSCLAKEDPKVTLRVCVFYSIPGFPDEDNAVKKKIMDQNEDSYTLMHEESFMFDQRLENGALFEKINLLVFQKKGTEVSSDKVSNFLKEIRYPE